MWSRPATNPQPRSQMSLPHIYNMNAPSRPRHARKPAVTDLLPASMTSDRHEMSAYPRTSSLEQLSPQGVDSSSMQWPNANESQLTARSANNLQNTLNKSLDCGQAVHAMYTFGARIGSTELPAPPANTPADARSQSPVDDGSLDNEDMAFTVFERMASSPPEASPAGNDCYVSAPGSLRSLDLHAIIATTTPDNDPVGDENVHLEKASAVATPKVGKKRQRNTSPCPSIVHDENERAARRTPGKVLCEEDRQVLGALVNL